MEQKECYEKEWDCDDHACPYYLMCMKKDFNPVVSKSSPFGIVYYSSKEIENIFPKFCLRCKNEGKWFNSCDHCQILDDSEIPHHFEDLIKSNQ